MKRIIVLVFVLLVATVGISFTARNAQPVRVDYYVGVADFPLSLLLVGTLILGVLLGVTASIGMVLSSRREAQRLRRRVKASEQEVSNLRALPLKE